MAGELLIEAVINMLEDGDWHTFKKIKDDLQITEPVFQKILRFLSTFEIAEVEKEKLRINPSFLELPV